MHPLQWPHELDSENQQNRAPMDHPQTAEIYSHINHFEEGWYSKLMHL